MGILDGIVDWLATQVMNLLDLASASVLGALGCNMDTFKRYFPTASAMYEIFIWTAIGLVLLNLVWQLYRCYGAGFDMQIPATGENIPTAMATAESDTVTDSPIPATPLALEGDSTVDVSPTRDSEITMHAGGSPAVTEQTTIPTSSSIQQAAMNRVLLGQMGNSVTDVEIGGGKIQGREIIPGRGQIQFAMYNARQYEKPEGHFTEQTSRDGEKWYKVYATTRVEKTPTIQDERGRMQYDERKVAAMPKAPARRH